MFITPSGVNTFFTSGSLFQVFRSLRQRQKDVSRKKKNKGAGKGVFFSRSFPLCRTPLSERLEQATHLVVIVTTLETPKKIFCYNNNIMRNDNFKQDHLGQEHYEQPYKVFYRFLDVLNIKTVTKQVWFYFICGTTRLRYMGTIMTLQIVLNTPKNLYLNQATP